jgi:hypothetical protein
MFDSNHIQNDFIYQIGGSTFEYKKTKMNKYYCYVKVVSSSKAT